MPRGCAQEPARLTGRKNALPAVWICQRAPANPASSARSYGVLLQNSDCVLLRPVAFQALRAFSTLIRAPGPCARPIGRAEKTVSSALDEAGQNFADGFQLDRRVRFPHADLPEFPPRLPVIPVRALPPEILPLARPPSTRAKDPCKAASRSRPRTQKCGPQAGWKDAMPARATVMLASLSTAITDFSPSHLRDGAHHAAG